MSATDPLPTPHDYRMHGAFAARFVGLALVLVAVVMFVGTAVVALAGLSGDLLVVLLVLGVVGVFVLGWWLRARASILHVDADGYTVHLVRGAGVKQARWKDVEDAATATPHGIACVVLRLRDGRTTSIPVQALAVDRDQFVRELQRRLRDGQGLRPLGGS
ncbi:MAG: hypothetical protein F2667_08295 [Actinobacteria bacterium]|uniref:Unannotated protein n=1 Tax=freshwater metagenome TaxID=449393 RepID=A0A6J6QN63_9ZZZZ|nr:hypothetical protein [Actinomycetota bacterium]